MTLIVDIEGKIRNMIGKVGYRRDPSMKRRKRRRRKRGRKRGIMVKGRIEIKELMKGEIERKIVKRME